MALRKPLTNKYLPHFWVHRVPHRPGGEAADWNTAACNRSTRECAWVIRLATVGVVGHLALPSELASRQDGLRSKLRAAEDAVAITLDLKPEVEAELMAQAQAAGLSLAQFLSRELEAIAPAAPAPVPATLPDASDQWEKEFDEWLDSFPQHPVLHEEAFKRENWYPDRW